MKYAIIVFQSNGIRVDFGQNGGFDTMKEALKQASDLGLTLFSVLPVGGVKEWAKYPSVSTVKTATSKKGETPTVETPTEETPAV